MRRHRVGFDDVVGVARRRPGQRIERQPVADRRIAGDQVALLGAQEPRTALPPGGMPISGAMCVAAPVMIPNDRQHVADRAFEALLEDPRQALALQRILHFRFVDHDIAGQAPFAPEVVPGVLVGREKIVRVELQALREGEREAVRRLDGSADRLALQRIELRIAPDRFAVLAPVAAQRPAWQLLAGVPFALAEMQQRSGREPACELAEQHARQPPLLGPQRQRIPLRSVHVVDRHEGRLAAHGEPQVVLADVVFDRLADLEQRGPLLLGVGLGRTRRLAHARHRHRMLELDLGLLDCAFDRRGARWLGRAGEGNVAFAGQQAGRRIEADPPGARQIDLAPGVEVGEIVRRTFRPVERLLVGDELDQVARGEARGEAQVAQDHDQQPAGVAARSLGAAERLLAALHARLHPDDVADLALQPSVQPDDEIDGALLLAVDRREPGRQFRPHRFQLAERRNFLGQPGVVGKGPRLGRGLEEEVEWVDDRHIGHQVDRDVEQVGLLGKDQPGQVVSLRILLPVDEMLGRRDLQRIGQDGRPAMGCRTQTDDLRPQFDGSVVPVGRPMMQRDLDAHDGLLFRSEDRLSKRHATKQGSGAMFVS